MKKLKESGRGPFVSGIEGEGFKGNLRKTVGICYLDRRIQDGVTGLDSPLN
ncbi:hypothetical protein ACWF5S_23790 [Peribacillus butanolivorans]